MGIALEIIEWKDEESNQIVYRAVEGGEIKWGAAVIVNENQSAIFYRDGKALGVLEPGRHHITTQNFPVLTNLLSFPYGFKSPFHADVYYVNRKVFINLKWGTKQPITYRDSEFGIISLRSFGIFSIKVADPMLFVNTIVGAQRIYSSEILETYLKDIIISRLSDLLGKCLSSILDLPKKYNELSSITKSKVLDDLGKYGIELVDLFINAITPTEEVQKAIAERSSMSVIGNIDEYLKYQTAIAIKDAANNPAGDGSAATGMNLGMGAAIGMMIPRVIEKTLENSKKMDIQKDNKGQDEVSAETSGKNANRYCSQCGSSTTPEMRYCSNCGKKLQ